MIDQEAKKKIYKIELEQQVGRLLLTITLRGVDFRAQRD